MKPDGLIMRWSQFAPMAAMDRLVAGAIDRRMTVFARINHTALANGVGIALRPMEVLLFGNPQVGTPLMQASPTLAIDLPLRAMVWQDEAGKTCITYYDPAWLAKRHRVPAEFGEQVQMMSAVVADLVQWAARGEATGGPDT